MAFIDGLQETCTINTITYAEDAHGKESKVAAPILSDIKCRLGKGTPRLINTIEKKEEFITTYKLYTELTGTYGSSGDQVIIDSVKYIIIGGQPATGGKPGHYIYNIKIDNE